MKSVIFLFVFLLPFQCLPAEQGLADPLFSEEAWKQIKPRLLPPDHPAKAALDKIFSQPHVNQNGQTLANAGFRFSYVRTKLNAVVARHPKLKGYLIKTFTDEQPVPDEWTNWINRIQGAEMIREFITAKGYHSEFKAPQKWMYMIPYNCIHNVGRPLLLVVEDMKLESFEKNKKFWMKKMNPDKLTKLYDIIESLGLLDSVFIDNAPFARDGRIAFIDTEHALKWPVPYSKLNRRLSDQNRNFWIDLTQ